MKFAMKSIVAAAAFVAVGAASAATVTVTEGNTFDYNGQTLTAEGSGGLTFSDDLVAALNTGGVSAQAFGRASSQIDGTVGAYTAIGVTAPVTALTIDTSTYAITEALSTGGAKQVAAFKTGVATGGNVSVGNLRIDLVNKAVYGDIFGVGDAVTADIKNSKGVVLVAARGAVTVNEVGIKLFDITGDITGQTTVAGPGTYATSFTGLALTTAGFNALSSALGLYSIGRTALSGAAANFGQLDSVITVTAAVPEPSTYALMGLGLVGLSLVARRRAK